MPDSERAEYLALIIGCLMEQYVYTQDSDTKAEIDRLREELEKITENRSGTSK